MSAPKGNQYWRLADPDFIGRPRRFETPQDLWEAVKPYFDWCDENPWITQEFTTTDKGSYTKNTIHKIPYTWQGLFVFLGVSNLNGYKENEDFSTIYTHIAHIIYSQKYEGAAVGAFNANLISRDLGLTDKQDLTSAGEKLQTIIRMPDNNRDR